MENLFDVLCALLLHIPNRDLFLKAEGLFTFSAVCLHFYQSQLFVYRPSVNELDVTWKENISKWSSERHVVTHVQLFVYIFEKENMTAICLLFRKELGFFTLLKKWQLFVYIFEIIIAIFEKGHVCILFEKKDVCWLENSLLTFLKCYSCLFTFYQSQLFVDIFAEHEPRASSS